MQSHGIVVWETLKLACFVEIIKILSIRQFVKGNILTMLIAIMMVTLLFTLSENLDGVLSLP